MGCVEHKDGAGMGSVFPGNGEFLGREHEGSDGERETSTGMLKLLLKLLTICLNSPMLHTSERSKLPPRASWANTARKEMVGHVRWS